MGTLSASEKRAKRLRLKLLGQGVSRCFVEYISVGTGIKFYTTTQTGLYSYATTRALPGQA